MAKFTQFTIDDAFQESDEDKVGTDLKVSSITFYPPKNTSNFKIIYYYIEHAQNCEIHKYLSVICKGLYIGPPVRTD